MGKRGYDPVVRTSMAKGIAKLGKRACTRASLASNASLSAVSTNKMVCWSRKLEIICDRGRVGIQFSVLMDASIFKVYYENIYIHKIRVCSYIDFIILHFGFENVYKTKL